MVDPGSLAATNGARAALFGTSIASEKVRSTSSVGLSGGESAPLDTQKGSELPRVGQGPSSPFNLPGFGKGNPPIGPLDPGVIFAPDPDAINGWSTCYVYQAWARLPGTEKMDPCPVEYYEDWDCAEFATCLPNGMTYEDAVADLEDELGSGWRDALWGLVDLESEVDDKLEGNLASRIVEPLWYEWESDKSNYEPQTTSLPRKTFMLRVLDLIVRYKEGIPKTQQDTEIWPWVVDTIEAGAMSFRLYERDYELNDESLSESLLALVNQLQELKDDLDELAGDVADAVAAIPDWIADAVGSLVPALRDIIDLIDAIVDCLLGAGDCDDVEAAMDELASNFAWVVDLIEWLADLGVELAEDLIALMEDARDLAEDFEQVVLDIRQFLAEFDVEEVLMNLALRPVNCLGPEHLEWVSGPPVEALSGSVGADEADCRATCGPSVSGQVNMFGGIDFQFQYTGTSKGSEGFAANHGVFPAATLSAELSAAGVDVDLTLFPWGNRVWFCDSEVDVCAMMYDWLVALATRHYARSFSRAMDESERQKQLLAANMCLRMALSVAVDFGRVVLHETMHNRSLFHCDEPDLFGGRNIGCQQDAVAVPWRLYTTAKLGLPWTAVHGNSSGAVATPWSVRINWDIGYSVDNDVSIAQQDCHGNQATASTGLTPLQPYGWTGSVHCENGNFLFTSATAASTAEDIGEALIVIGTILGSATLVAAGTIVDALAELPVSGNIGADTVFNIDRPLEMGGQVTSCCIVNRPEECAGSTDAVSCWPLSDPPCGMDYEGCCCAPEEEDDEWGFSILVGFDTAGNLVTGSTGSYRVDTSSSGILLG